MFNQRKRWIGSGIMPSPGHNNHNLWLVLPQSQFGFNFSALLQLCFPAALSDGRWVMGNASVLEFRRWRFFLPGIFRILVLFLLPLGWPFRGECLSWLQGNSLGSGSCSFRWFKIKAWPSRARSWRLYSLFSTLLEKRNGEGMEAKGCVTMNANPLGIELWWEF